MYLADYGERCTVFPIGGGPPWSFVGIPDRPTRRTTELELGGGLAGVEISGSEPKLLAVAADVEDLNQGDRVTVPKWAPKIWSVHLVEPDGEEEDFSVVLLTESES